MGHGERGWNNPHYGLVGQTYARSSYDQVESVKDTGMHTRSRNGIFSSWSRAPISEPTMTRLGRVSAQYNSAANAAIFQGTFATSWSGPFAFGGSIENPIVRPPHTPLGTQLNPNAQGAKEPMRATQYVPWPASGDVYPKAI
jgi:hypothetical protein